MQDLNKYVAISEEFANNPSDKIKSGGLLFDRKVTRVITPGTLIDEKFMDPFDNNFLLAIHPGQVQPLARLPEKVSIEPKVSNVPTSLLSKSVGLAWLDLSTGDFFTQVVDVGTLGSALARIAARETVMMEDRESPLQQDILHILEQDRHLVSYYRNHLEVLPISTWSPMLEAPVSSAAEALFTHGEVAAGGLLLAYVRENLQGLGLKLQPPVRKQENETMVIDRNSLKGLEVLQTARDGLGGGKGSLLHSVRRTTTKSGARLLKDWISKFLYVFISARVHDQICIIRRFYKRLKPYQGLTCVASPSMALPTINARLNLVSRFRHDQSLREYIMSLLSRTFDSQRLVQKFSLGRGDADDLISLLRTIEATNEIANVLGKDTYSSELDMKAEIETTPQNLEAFQNLSRRLALDGPKVLASRIAAAIDEDGLIQSHRLQENNSADMVSLAQDILLEEGSLDDKKAMSAILRNKPIEKRTLEQQTEEQETWIMRKRST